MENMPCTILANQGLSSLGIKNFIAYMDHISLNIFILHRLRNKFLQLILISLDSASWITYKAK